MNEVYTTDRNWTDSRECISVKSTHNNSILKVTCYSEGEAGFMERSQTLRAHIINPLLKLLTQCQITPNQLTLLSLVVGLAFCLLFAWSSMTAAFIMLFLHA
ncbi:CDP-alcohol phosphatidyltransferase family protein, partial [Gammaproteobacteria bacterium]|nr:CDP-alcohol phosphatidyltransferase family protein [Gammaproteobacteria bacterium]